MHVWSRGDGEYRIGTIGPAGGGWLCHWRNPALETPMDANPLHLHCDEIHVEPIGDVVTTGDVDPGKAARIIEYETRARAWVVHMRDKAQRGRVLCFLGSEADAANAQELLKREGCAAVGIGPSVACVEANKQAFADGRVQVLIVVPDFSAVWWAHQPVEATMDDNDPQACIRNLRHQLAGKTSTVNELQSTVNELQEQMRKRNADLAAWQSHARAISDKYMAACVERDTALRLMQNAKDEVRKQCERRTTQVEALWNDLTKFCEVAATGQQFRAGLVILARDKVCKCDQRMDDSLCDLCFIRALLRGDTTTEGAASDALAQKQSMIDELLAQSERQNKRIADLNAQLDAAAGLLTKVEDERDRLRGFCERLSAGGYGPPTLLADVRAFLLKATLEPTPQSTGDNPDGN
jgi:hypothetical protein